MYMEENEKKNILEGTDILKPITFLVTLTMTATAESEKICHVLHSYAQNFSPKQEKCSQCVNQQILIKYDCTNISKDYQ